jgi:flagellar biosynthesis/type III secretory pathway chaperone
MADQSPEDQLANNQKELLQAYKNIFLYSPDGQIILRDLMKTSGLFRSTGMVPNEELQHITGTQDMVRRIFNILSLDDEQILNIANVTPTPTDKGEFSDE